MPKLISLLGYGLLISLASIAQSQEPNLEKQYPLSIDSFPKEGIPKGTVKEYIWSQSKVYPGTIRRHYTYIPAQYASETPVALMVFQDGHTYLKEDGDFRVPTVFGNLIASKDIPVTIGVFVDL